MRRTKASILIVMHVNIMEVYTSRDGLKECCNAGGAPKGALLRIPSVIQFIENDFLTNFIRYRSSQPVWDWTLRPTTHNTRKLCASHARNTRHTDTHHQPLSLSDFLLIFLFP